MSKIDLVAIRQRIGYASAVALSMLVVLSLSACVDLTPRWEKKVQTSDARGVDGKLDTAPSGNGGAGGNDAGSDSSVAPEDPKDASAAGGGSDSSDGGGGAGGSSGSGGADGAADAGGAGGAADARRADGTVDALFVSSGDASRDGGADKEASDGGGQVDRSDSLGPSGGDVGDSGADSSSDSRGDFFEASSGTETAREGPPPSEVGMDSGVQADLAPDLGPDIAPDLPPDQSSCKPTTFDAKTLNHSAGQAESDGWYLSATGQFLWLTGFDYPAGRTTVTVVARGDFVSGAWPTMDVSAQGQSNIIGTAAVSSATMTAYSFTFNAAAMNSGAGVTAKSGNGVHVQSITIGCPSH